LHTSKSPQKPDEFSPEDESIQPIYNEATMNRPMIADEEEWLAQFSIIEPQYNPITMSFIEPDEE
jgi:hypothetical protein